MNLGFLVVFGLGRPYAVEYPKRHCDHDEKSFYSYVWELWFVSDPQELRDQFLGEQNSVYARNGKTSYLILAF